MKVDSTQTAKATAGARFRMAISVRLVQYSGIAPRKICAFIGEVGKHSLGLQAPFGKVAKQVKCGACLIDSG